MMSISLMELVSDLGIVLLNVT